MWMDAQKATLGVLEAVVSLEIIVEQLLKVFFITMKCVPTILRRLQLFYRESSCIDIGKGFVVGCGIGLSTNNGDYQ